MMNKYQTVFTEEDFKLLPKEVKAEFYEFLETVPFIKWLIQPEEFRGFAKNLPRWDKPNDLKNRKENSKGRIYVDITKPHILEDMDFFRERAIFFDKYGKYTDITPNPNPKSDYAKFWKKEVKKWREGMYRESDGEWIPGGLYFYWNYCPIWLVEESKNSDVEGTRQRKFPKPWLGDYLFFHYMEQARNNGEHVKMLKTRGVGASFKMGSLSPRNMYVFPGSGNPNFHLASDKTFLTGDKGVFGKVIDTLDWIADNTPLPKLRLVNSLKSMEIQLGYQDEYGVRKGPLSSVYGISLKDNPDKARGIRGPLIHYEEDGLFPHLESAWNINRKAVEDGKVAFGQMVAMGTGGVEGGDFAGAEKLFYNPTVYRIYGIPNVYDKNSTGKTLCGFFWGAYLNRKGCYDVNSGEPDVTKALMEIVINRVKTRASATDSKTITQNMAEEPITPQEAVMRIEGTVFPVADLKDYLGEISSNMLKFTSPHYVGNLIINSQGEVEFRNDSTVYPVRDFPALDNKKGAVEIYELPKKSKDSFRYILGCLPTGEKVLTNKGLINVENVTLEHKLINKEGVLVTIKNLQEYNVKDEDIYTFKVNNTFRKTTFTKEHPIYVSKNKFGYVSYNKTKRLGVTQKYHKFTFNFEKAADVKVGDYIQVPNIYLKESNFNYCEYWDNIGYRTDKLINNPLNNEDFWWFIGLWLGDGWCESDGYNISVSFNKSEKFYIDKLKNLINTLFNRKYNERIRNNCVEIKFSFQQLNSFMTNTFGKYAYGKFIPEWVKYLPNNFKTSLILGYLNSDGSVTKNNTIEFVSINLELLESVQDILFSLGVISALSKLRNASEYIINNKVSNTKETYHLRISYHNSILLKEILKCKDDIKLKKLTITKDKLRRFPEGSCFFSSDKTYIYFKITEIEKSKYTGKVYNFECDTHTFMCHHITTHNCDPYDDDIVEYSDSLGSAIVFDRYTRRIVSEYTGRPGSANEFYEIVYRLARFYNATIMYENNKKGLFAYFNNVKGAITMLADTPEILTDKQLSKPKSIAGNVSKGINATAAINSYGLRLQADWMLEPAYSEEIIEQGEEEFINKVLIPNFRKIRSVGYIKEAVAWHPKLNADRVSAMNMVMIYDTELSQYETFGTKSTASSSIDPFYSKIYPVGKDSGTLIRKGNKLVFGYTPK